ADAVAAFEAELAAVDPSPTRDDSAIDGVAIEEPAAASTDQLEHARTELERELAILRRDLDEIDERRLDAETAAAGIDAAIAAHLEAAATIGAALLEDRADASQETRDALAAAIEALSESTSADAAVALAAYAETAAAVVASSDQA